MSHGSHFHGVTISRHMLFSSFLGLNALGPQTKIITSKQYFGYKQRLNNKIKKKNLKKSYLLLLTSPDKFHKKHEILLSL